ncbi:Uncharacterised protein [Mycobacteroides abscessus subsp. abscessus]|nr:Uncharacterised protein [Mycobacteroides abscessus subsp. abscessus]
MPEFDNRVAQYTSSLYPSAELTGTPYVDESITIFWNFSLT